MGNTKIIDNLNDISKYGIEKCIVLYSGGIDGSFFLDWASKQGIEATALHVGLLGKKEGIQAKKMHKS